MTKKMKSLGLVVLAIGMVGNVTKAEEVSVLPEFKSVKTEIKFVQLPGGKFTMGSDKEKDNPDIKTPEYPVREITLSPFAIGKYELTYRQWKMVMDWALKNGYKGNQLEKKTNATCAKYHLKDYKPKLGIKDPGLHDNLDYPVGGFGANQGIVWCNALSEFEGKQPFYYMSSEKKEVYRQHQSPIKFNIDNSCVDWDADGYRIPTEAEWEYACRAGTTTEYISGDTWDGAYGWDRINTITEGKHINEGSRIETQLGGLRKPNAFGIYDMIGNKLEPIWDFYGAYDPNDLIDPKGPDKAGWVRPGQKKMLKCRQLRSFSTWWGDTRSARRVGYPHGGIKIGLRVVTRGQ